MQIEGDTIKFKSDAGFFSIEEMGWKPNTIRILDKNEITKINAWWGSNNYHYIEITSTGGKSFKRTLTWIGKLDDFLGKEIYMFCWKHPSTRRNEKCI